VTAHAAIRVGSLARFPQYVPHLCAAFALESAVEAEARRRGCEYLHAATNRIEVLLVRRGWAVFDRVEHHGAPMAWLRKRVAPA
jgi:hypothetical protein